MMKKLIALIEKAKPFFEKIAANPYLTAIRDGFVAVMPIVIFSSIFLLVTVIPNTWGFKWSDNTANILMKMYNYSMGILALFIVGTTAKSLTDNRNTLLPKTSQLNAISVFVASQISFLIIASNPIENGLSVGDIGSRGLLAAFVVAFIVPNIYYFCMKRNITIKMPPQVPGNIAQTFKDMLPFGLSVSFFWIIDLAIRHFFNDNLAALIINALSPLFSAADSYLGFAIIFGFTAFFWFIGVHGPSIVGPAVTAIYYLNTSENLALFQSGKQASHALTQNMQDFIALMGGTGATFVVPYLFMLVCKSKELKVVGKISVVPTSFGVNEPVLFGAPLILNPIFFFPFILTPIINSWIGKFFIETLHMNGPMHLFPWMTPGPIGIVLTTSFAPLAFLLVPILLIVDTIIWYPFIKVYDKEKLEEEAQQLEEQVVENESQEIEKFMPTDETNILVLCAGGGTSGILANALNKLAKERQLKLQATARAYGQDMDLIQNMNLVILAPQMESMKDELTKYCDQYGVKVATTNGRTYIQLTRDSEKALAFIAEHLEK